MPDKIAVAAFVFLGIVGTTVMLLPREPLRNRIYGVFDLLVAYHRDGHPEIPGFRWFERMALALLPAGMTVRRFRMSSAA